MIIDGPESGRIDVTSGAGRVPGRRAVPAAAESDTTGARVRAAFAVARSEGKMLGGARVFGFNRGGDAGEQRPDEAAVLREMAGRVIEGEPLATLADELNTRGITTTRGNEFTGGNLGRLLGLRRLGGDIEYQGEIVGRLSGEPILDRDTYDRVQALTASRRRGRRPTDRYPLSGGLVHCGRCGHTLGGGTTTKNRGALTTMRLYRCVRATGGCGQSVSADRLEERVRTEVLAVLNAPKARAQITKHDAAMAKAREDADQRIDDINRNMIKLEVKLAQSEGKLQRAYDAAMPIWLERLTTRLAEKAALDVAGPVGPGPVVSAPIDAGPIEPGSVRAGVGAAEWDQGTGAERRQLVKDARVNITVLPPLANRGPTFDQRRVVIT